MIIKLYIGIIGTDYSHSNSGNPIAKRSNSTYRFSSFSGHGQHYRMYYYPSHSGMLDLQKSLKK